MPLVESIAKLRLLASRPNRPLVSYFAIKGPINSETTYQINQILKKVPKKSKKIALIVNSAGGDPSQACIISDKIKKKAKDLDAQFITFAEQFALNAGFFLLSQGNRVFADKTTYVGGIQVGKMKTNLGVISEYLTNVVYAEENTYEAELKKDEPFQEPKASQMRELFSSFSQQMKNRILSSRKNIQNPSQIDLTKIYYGEEAHKLGLIDGVGRIHETMPKLLENPRIEPLMEGKLKNTITNLRRISFNG